MLNKTPEQVLKKLKENAILKKYGQPVDVNKELDGTPYLEWIFGKNKRLILFFDENNITYLISWGANIHSEMENGIIENIKDVRKIMERLYEM